MADRINVCRDGKAIYDIVLTQSFDGLKEAVSCLPVKEHKICIVTDSNVAPLYLEEVRAVLAGCCKAVSVFTFPAGEEHKHLDTVRNLYEHLILEHFDRKDLLAALGGGVVGDLTGFTAATYLRGIGFIQIPTTLLSQVDSSIGGKTGVDFDSYKNMVGAFHMPRLVYMNLSVLKTLPKRQFASGMAEILKHGLIKNEGYFQWLLDEKKAVCGLDMDALLTMIEESCKVKRAVVEEDPTEQGDRALLNFGHTIGHAIERYYDYGVYTHGEAVAAGMSMLTGMTEEMGLTQAGTTARLRHLLQRYGLPQDVDATAAELLPFISNDKKMRGQHMTLVILKEIGKARLLPLDASELPKFIRKKGAK